MTSKKSSFFFWVFFFFVLYVILLYKVLTLGGVASNIFFGAYSVIITSYVLSRFVLAYFYKPVASDPAFQPSVTFVVPVKNEEENIAKTIACFGASQYPREKMEAVIVNDGSTDRTLQEIRKARDQAAFPVKIVNWKINRGKREAMAEGVRCAKNQIILFVDSDSFVDPECVRNLTKYFSDPAVGAVCAHTDVFNKNVNVLTRMQALRYYIAFKVYKSAEAIFGVVTCCPGCCSAYRRSYVMEVLQQWRQQTFMGDPCTFGDDRSLTNFILRKYKTLFAQEAKAYTVVPEQFSKYVRQQLRWKKSWIRESLIAASFIWRKNPFAAFFFYVYIYLVFTSPIVFIRAMVWVPAVSGMLPAIYLFGLLLMLFLHGIFYRIQTKETHWVRALVHFWAQTVILIWQFPWALFTLKDARWGTR